MLNNKNILLGVCGSIAAYKAATLVRLLVKEGAHVKVVLTADAANFITPLTLATLSKNPVYNSYFDEETGVWTNHVELGLWADLLVIAPASANTLAKFANGICDNLLTAVYLSAKCPVYLAPAMDLDMWKHESTATNIATLQKFGNKIMLPAHGELASGLTGTGRMEEPENIVILLNNYLREGLPLAGKKALVSAGPTYEAIDPVRFIGNHSSGKMGFELATALKNAGATVTLVTGPTHEKINGVTRIDVVSAEEMLQACIKEAQTAQIIVMSAAVADYTPITAAPEKIKKADDTLTIELKKTTDILGTLGKQKHTDQILIGFALETQNELEYAKKKLDGKNLDFVVLNSLRDKDAGFKKDTNKITIIHRSQAIQHFDAKDKTTVAKDICTEIIKLAATR